MTSTEIKTIELIVNSEQAKKRLDDLNQRLTVMKQKRDETFARCRPRWTKFSKKDGRAFRKLSKLKSRKSNP